MEWTKCSDGLPDKNTRYAAKHGVRVLCYDEKEAKDSGYFTPTDYSFSFVDMWFLVEAYSSGGVELLPAEVTHWMPLPEPPKE